MKRRLISSIIEIIVGLVLSVLGFTGIVDEYWSGMGAALLIVGILFMIRQIRYRTNDEYREKKDIEYNDERNKYIAQKSWAWAAYSYVLIAALSTIAFKLVGREDMMMLASGSVCLIMVLYWISYLFVRKKY